MIDNSTYLVVGCARCGEADLSCVIGLPSGSLAAEVIVLVAGGKPSDICHVERDEARGGYHATFIVVVPSSSRTVGLDFRNLATAVPCRGRHLSGETFGCDALALEIVCHLVFGDSIPNSVNERLGFLFNDFAAPIGGGDVAGGFARDGRGRLFVEMGDSANPNVG